MRFTVQRFRGSAVERFKAERFKVHGSAVKDQSKKQGIHPEL